MYLNTPLRTKFRYRKTFKLHLIHYVENWTDNRDVFRTLSNKKRKHGPYCWHFRLNLKCLGWPYRESIKTAKNGGFCEELLSETDFEAILATFYCYDYGANASDAVQKIAADQKDYHKCSSCVTVCWIAEIYQSITVWKKVGYYYCNQSKIFKRRTFFLNVKLQIIRLAQGNWNCTPTH